jgi:hypothetical protein
MPALHETIPFNPLVMQQAVYNETVENYTPKEVQLATHYGMTVPDMRETVEAAKLYPNVTCDENGMPIGCSVEQWFDKLDKKLIEHFGEEFRIMVNESRSEWNEKGYYTFDLL